MQVLSDLHDKLIKEFISVITRRHGPAPLADRTWALSPQTAAGQIFLRRKEENESRLCSFDAVKFSQITTEHRLNMEVDLQSLVGLHVT